MICEASKTAIIITLFLMQILLTNSCLFDKRNSIRTNLKKVPQVRTLGSSQSSKTQIYLEFLQLSKS